VICPHLRGYGQSSKPATTADHSPYSKRAMARDILRLMHHLGHDRFAVVGHDRFAVVGHDRGSYVAARLALDAPEVVTRLAVLDSVSIGEALARADARFAAAWYHWFFFAQPELPERLIAADPAAFSGGDPALTGEENSADFQRAIHNPATVSAMLEDYRAGPGVDRAADDADRAADRRITCPTLVLWSTRDDMESLYGDVLAVWEPWTTDLRGAPIDSGHHMAEEAPGPLADQLATFLTPH